MSQEFISTTDGAIYYRTVLLSASRAHSFCKCLQANNRFKQVSVVESKSEGQYFVQYQPSSQARYGEMYARQYEQREVKGRTEGRCYEFHLHTVRGRDFYLCQSATKETYEVTAESCSCPDFTARCAKAGFPCKHMHAYFAQVAIGEIVSLNALAAVTLHAAETERIQEKLGYGTPLSRKIDACMTGLGTDKKLFPVTVTPTEQAALRSAVAAITPDEADTDQISLGALKKRVKAPGKPPLYSDRSWEVTRASYRSCGSMLVTREELAAGLCIACASAPLPIEVIEPARKRFDYKAERNYDFP